MKTRIRVRLLRLPLHSGLALADALLCSAPRPRRLTHDEDDDGHDDDDDDDEEAG